MEKVHCNDVIEAYTIPALDLSNKKLSLTWYVYLQCLEHVGLWTKKILLLF